METSVIADILKEFGVWFDPGWARSALVLALFSTGVVVGVFAYLNRYTKKSYFSLWTIGWIFYALWLGVCIGQDESPGDPILILIRRACIGVSALCMAWGSFELTNKGRRRSELLYGLALIAVWSYVAAYRVREQVWITVPVFALLAVASAYTGALHLQFRAHNRGAVLLGWGFVIWGIHLAFFCVQPLLSEYALVVGYFVSAALALFIAFGMIVYVLEETRTRNDDLLNEVNQGVATRRLLEQEVTVSEQKYRALFEAAGDAIFLVDLETLDVLLANEKAEFFLGLSTADGPQASFLSLCPSLPYRHGNLLENKKMIEELIKPAGEFQIVRHTGSVVLCEGSVNMVQYNQRPVLQINLREITERKQLEQQLRQSEKLSAFGQLIAGVAHELNNPLAVIMGYAQILVKQDAGPARPHNELHKILHEAERAAKIVRNLLTFARPREPRMEPVDINRLLTTIIETHEGELESSSVQCHLCLAANVPRTMADPHQVEQVVTNLLNNAIQAMSEHNGPRTLTLASDVVSNRAIRITVADSGPGIRTEIISKIFDPFFTTKTPGKGTGLGLSICHSIVEEHGGRIWVESELGKGAKFFVELPIIATAGQPGAEEARLVMVPPSPDAARFRILIVDDEPGIVEVLKAIMEGRGYRVETSSNGNEALERLQNETYDVIFSDLCMPGLDGEALHKCVKQLSPKLAERMIFITGDTVSRGSRTFLESSGNRWFGKPFNLVEVETVVANFLGDQPRA
jgi:PAS domain S-box-containing protein